MYMRRLPDICTAILLLILTAVATPLAHGREKRDMPFLETRVDRRNVVEGERLIYEVVLYSPDPNVAGLEMLREPGLAPLPYTQSSPDSQLSEVTVDGRKYFTAVIDRYFLGVNRKGKYTLSGGEYRLGLGHRVKVDDPFWGPMVRNQLETLDLKAPDLTVRAAALPLKNRPEAFSGAVGEFEVSVYLPEVELRAGEDAELVIDIVGYGDLTGASLPDIRKMLPEGLKFKSMTDNRSHYVKDGRLGSEIEIECVVCPDKEGTYTVDGIKFIYYDVEKGAYSTATAPEIRITVGDGMPSDGAPPVFIDV